MSSLILFGVLVALMSALMGALVVPIAAMGVRIRTELSFGFGLLSTLNVSMFAASHHSLIGGVVFSSTIAPLVLALVLVTGTWSLRRQLRSRRTEILDPGCGDSQPANYKSLLALAARPLLLMLGVLLFVVIRYAGAFRRGGLGATDLFSNANNDVALYVLGADNVIGAGFGDRGRVLDYDVGENTSAHTAGSSTLLALVSRIMRLEVWEAAQVLSATIVFASIMALVGLLAVIGFPRLWSAVVATFAFLAPFPVTVESNYFLGQSIARLALVMTIAALATVVFNSDRRALRTAVLVMSVAVVAQVLTYPTGALLNVGLLVVVAAIVVGGSVERAALAKRLALLGAATSAFSVLVLFPRWSEIIGHIRLYSRNNVTGWPSETLRLDSLLGVADWMPSGFSVSLAFLIGVVVASGIWLTRDRIAGRETSNVFGMSIVASTSLVYVAALVRGGSDSYQTWKVLGTVQPLFLGALAALALAGIARYAWLSWFSVGLIVVAGFVNVVGANRHWEIRQVPDRIMADTSVSERAGAVRSLDVALNPYLETMVAPVMLDVFGARYAADTYRGPSSPDGRCLITRDGSLDGARPLSATLYLVGSDCDRSTPGGR